MSAVISDAAFLTVKVCQGRYQSYNCPSLHTILLFSKMNWVRCNDRFNLGLVDCQILENLAILILTKENKS